VSLPGLGSKLRNLSIQPHNYLVSPMRNQFRLA
jgi:hypothetical protein